MINPNFLNVKFNEITLIHILVVLGIPYLILYLFEKFTKFDKFTEKWEAGLFVFSIGGAITLVSIYIQEYSKIDFIISYCIGMIFFVLILWAIKSRFYRNTNNEKRTGWIKIRLKNGELYTGVYESKDKFGIQILAGKKDKITKEIRNKEVEINAKKIKFSWNEILSMLYY